MSDTTIHDHGHVLQNPGISEGGFTENDHHHEFNAVFATPGVVDQYHNVTNGNVELTIFHHVEPGDSGFVIFDVPGHSTDAPLI